MPMAPNHINSEIADILRLVADHKASTRLILVVNTKNVYALPDDYASHSVTTEYLSDIELDHLLGGFRDAGIVTDLYLGERQFLNDLVGAGITKGSPRSLVYSTVSSGIWHGRDALIASLCGVTGITYCCSDAYAMGVAGNKYYALRLAGLLGESTAELWLYNQESGWCNDREPPLGSRVLIKPALECASIGVDQSSIRMVTPDFRSTVLDELSTVFQQPILIQEFIPGYEVEVPVFGAPVPVAPAAIGVSLDGEALLGDEILTYDRVYHDKYGFYPFANINPGLSATLSQSACKLFTELNLYGFARIDYRVRTDGTWGITDINAIPHMTPDSSTNLAFATLNLSYPEILSLIVGAGLRKALRRSQK